MLLINPNMEPIQILIIKITMIKWNNKKISKATKKINLTQQLIIYRSMEVN
jgi:hypothetical protein